MTRGPRERVSVVPALLPCRVVQTPGFDEEGEFVAHIGPRVTEQTRRALRERLAREADYPIDYKSPEYRAYVLGRVRREPAVSGSPVKSAEKFAQPLDAVKVTPPPANVPELPNVPVVTEPYNLIQSGTSDWSKATLDLLAPDGTHMVDTADELREVLAIQGFTVEHFKTLDAYKLALASGKYPWLADL